MQPGASAAADSCNQQTIQPLIANRNHSRAARTHHGTATRVRAWPDSSFRPHRDRPAAYVGPVLLKGSSTELLDHSFARRPADGTRRQGAGVRDWEAYQLR